MRLVDSHLRLGRRSGLVLLIAALGVGALGLGGCRAVQDNLTGVEINPDLAAWGQPNECVRACIMDWSEDLRAEVRVHIENKQACLDFAGDGQLAAMRLSLDEVEGLLHLTDEELLDREIVADQSLTDPPEFAECIRRENDRFRAAFEALKADRESCIEDCNYESGGGGR